MSNDSFKLEEENIENQPLLYLTEYSKKVFTPKETDIQEFIKNFINNYNLKFDTWVKDNNIVQTFSGHHRSSGDIYRICKYYFPNENLTLSLILNILYVLVYEKSILTQYCTDIDKRVFLPNFDYLSNYSFDRKDEYDLYFEEWKTI